MGKYEVRFEAKVGRCIKMWSRRTNIFDDAEGYDTFKGFESLRIEVVRDGRVLDTYTRERRRS